MVVAFDDYWAPCSQPAPNEWDSRDSAILSSPGYESGGFILSLTVTISQIAGRSTTGPSGTGRRDKISKASVLRPSSCGVNPDAQRSLNSFSLAIAAGLSVKSRL